MESHEVSIKSVADSFRLKPSVLADYYKNHLSGFPQWEQYGHVEEYILFPENIGAHVSLDETSLSNGELYTNVCNKDGHGRKGTVIAMVRGTKSEDVEACLERIPLEERLKVRTVTLDMADNMHGIALRCFPNAIQVIDRFHVQKLMYDVLQDVRVQYRWQAIEEENKQRKEAKAKGEKFVPEVFENGDTRRQLLLRSRYLLFKSPSHWTETQRKRAEILFKQYDDLKQFYYLSLQLGQVYSTNYDKNVARVKMALWFNRVEEWEYPQFNTVINSFKAHYERILNFFIERHTNANAESFNAKLKAFRTTFRGVGDIKFFLFRVAKLYA